MFFAANKANHGCNQIVQCFTERTQKSLSLNARLMRRSFNHHPEKQSIVTRLAAKNAAFANDGYENEQGNRMGPVLKERNGANNRFQNVKRDKRNARDEDYLYTLRGLRKSSKRFDSAEDISRQYERSGSLTNAQKAGMPFVKLQAGKANMFMDGNPIVYGGAIEERGGEDIKDGDAVGVFDHNMRPIAWGVWNGQSMFKVRVLELGKEIDGAILVKRVIKKRIEEAKALRDVLGITSEHSGTNAYRLINSEGDRLSGMIIDKYGSDNHFVVSASASWVEKHRKDVIDALREVFLVTKKEDGNDDGKTMTVVWRRDVDMYALEGVDVTGEKTSVYDKNGNEVEHKGDDLKDEIEILENGVKYMVNLVDGHKTGFYVDQRENRKFLGKLAAAAAVNNNDFSVLDLCTYTGGFAINAALNKCTKVTAVDSSKIVLKIAERNAELNKVSDKIKFVASDAFDFLDDCIERGEQFDVVVCDPPKFAPTVKSLEKSLSKYIGLNSRALRCVKPGGVLISCSCSGAITQRKLLPSIVYEAAQAANRRVAKIQESSAGGDQPIDPSFPEGEYLSVLAVRVM
jgi:23S rRNA G2069 N7-methylase RlmK/C1962 C5-methylase RlmI